MEVALRIEVETLAEALDQLDYFAVLKLAATAAPAEIRAAYHRESRVYHPDRYAAVDDEPFRDRVGRIYRRINEAYTVLRDDARRKKYAGDLAGPDRARKLRFSEDDEAAVKEAQKKRAVEQLGQTPNGRKFYAAALADAAGRTLGGRGAEPQDGARLRAGQRALQGVARPGREEPAQAGLPDQVGARCSSTRPCCAFLAVSASLGALAGPPAPPLPLRRRGARLAGGAPPLGAGGDACSPPWCPPPRRGRWRRSCSSSS